MNNSNKIRGLIAILILLLSFIRIYLHAKPVTVDDPFITFRYSYNLSQGKGFVYNEGEKWLGTTTPFYALLLAFFGLFSDNIPEISKWIGLLCFAGTVLIIYLYFRRLNLDFVGLLAGFSMIPIHPLSHLYGFETHFYIFLIFLTLYLYLLEKYCFVAVFSGILFLTRPDGIAVIFVLAAHYVISNRKFPTKAFLIFVATCLPWFLFATFYYGSPLPKTVFAKVAQGDTEIWTVSFGELLLNNALRQPLIPILALFGIISVFFAHKKVIPVALWFFAYILGFAIAGVPADYGWYFAPLVPGVAIFVFLDVIDRIKHYIKLGDSRLGRYFICGLLIAFIMFMSYRSVKHRLLFDAKNYDLRHKGYVEIANWLNENVEAGETIAASEVGILGYYCPEMKFVDFYGLVTPGVAQKLKTTPLNKFGKWFLKNFEPEYVVLFDEERWNNTGIKQKSPDFLEKYELIKSFKKSDDNRWSWNLYKIIFPEEG